MNPVIVLMLFILGTQIAAVIGMIYYGLRDYYSYKYGVCMCWGILGAIPNMFLAMFIDA
jgi:hypothetical protein